MDGGTVVGNLCHKTKFNNFLLTFCEQRNPIRYRQPRLQSLLRLCKLPDTRIFVVFFTHGFAHVCPAPPENLIEKTFHVNKCIHPEQHNTGSNLKSLLQYVGLLKEAHA